MKKIVAISMLAVFSAAMIGCGDDAAKQAPINPTAEQKKSFEDGMSKYQKVGGGKPAEAPKADAPKADDKKPAEPAKK